MIINGTENQTRKRKTGGTRERHITAVVKMNQRKDKKETKRRDKGAPVAVRMRRE